MRKSNTIEGLIDRAEYFKALVDMGRYDMIEPYLRTRTALKAIHKKEGRK